MENDDKQKCNENVYVLCDYLHSLFDANARGICYWKKHRKHQCYKCNMYGHIAADCEKVCEKCQNIHNNSICVFSIEKLYRKIIKILREATIPDLEKVKNSIEVEMTKIEKENIQSLSKNKYLELEVQQQSVVEIHSKIDPYWQMELKPSALETVQISGIKIVKSKPAKPIVKAKLFTPDTKVASTKQSQLRYYKGQPEKPCFTMNFQQYTTQCYGYGYCQICDSFHKPKTVLPKSIQPKGILDFVRVNKTKPKQGQVTINELKGERMITYQNLIAGKLKFLSGLLMEGKRKITEYMKMKKFKSQFQQISSDYKQLIDQVKFNRKQLKMIRSHRLSIIDNYKRVAESHVARREYAVTRQKQKLNQRWKELKAAKVKFYDKKDKYYEKKEKFYAKKDELYNKFKINKEELKDSIKKNIRGHYKGKLVLKDEMITNQTREINILRSELQRLQPQGNWLAHKLSTSKSETKS